jgi:formyltetrahydrofolate-dependent phosphoribosylglycinamide formyltransferase
MTTPKPVAVLVSGGGTNLQALLDRFGREGRPDGAAAVRLVLSDRPGVRALERARAAGVETAVVPPGEFEGTQAVGEALLARLRAHGVELVVLAGYLRLVPAVAVAAFRGRMVNVHPGPLPAFGGPGLYGRAVHEAVLRAGLKVSGPTVHFVDERYDTGPIIAQWPVPVFAEDTVETLAERVLHVEHRLLPAVLSALARGRISLAPDGRVLGPPGPGPRDLGFAAAGEADALDTIDRTFATE